MAGRPTPLLLQQVQHIPDGTRRLLIDRPMRGLECEVAAMNVACHVTASGRTPPVASCQRVIKHGLHMLVYRPVHPTTDALGGKYRYCVPCALREWSGRGVHEADQ